MLLAETIARYGRFHAPVENPGGCDDAAAGRVRQLLAGAGEGGADHDRLRLEAEASGVFGVPTCAFDGELVWGGDRIGLLRERLDEKGVRRR